MKNVLSGDWVKKTLEALFTSLREVGDGRSDVFEADMTDREGKPQPRIF